MIAQTHFRMGGGLGLSPTLTRRASGLPTLPDGFAFVTNDSGDYFITDGGDYVIQEVA